jgi:hypothetical protein
MTCIIGLLGVVGCSEPSQLSEGSPISDPVLTRASDTPTPTLIREDYLTPSVEIYTIEPTEQLILPTVTQDGGIQPTIPEVKEGLVATDPKSVQLASGSPQLIEFFAFW